MQFIQEKLLYAALGKITLYEWRISSNKEVKQSQTLILSALTVYSKVMVPAKQTIQQTTHKTPPLTRFAMFGLKIESIYG